MDDSRIKIVVGLGNPGKRYERTRHNVGFRVLGELAARLRAGGEMRKGFQGLYHDVRLGPQRVILLAPQTFMNLSGSSVLEATSFFKVPLDDVLVVLDDMALPLGRLRFRPEGSSGGQKGLGDIVARLGSDQVPRLRVGIGSPPAYVDGADFVLTPFAPAEVDVIGRTIEVAAEAAEGWILRGMAYVMEKYNRKGGEPKDNEE